MRINGGVELNPIRFSKLYGIQFNLFIFDPTLLRKHLPTLQFTPSPISIKEINAGYEAAQI